VRGKIWLVTSTSAYLALMEKSSEPELLAGPKEPIKLKEEWFRFNPAVPGAICIDCPDAIVKYLTQPGIAPIKENQWKPAGKDTRLIALRANGGPDGPAAHVKAVPEAVEVMDVIGAGEFEDATFAPMGMIETEGAPFVPFDERNSPNTIVGVGVRSRNANDPNRPVGRILGRTSVMNLIEGGKRVDVDREALLNDALGSWGDRQALEGAYGLLESRGYGSIKRWWIANLVNGEWRGKYTAPEGGARLLAVVPENPADQLDLVLNKPANAGHGEDRELFRDAFLKIDSAGDAAGADIIVQSVTDNPKAIRASSSRVLFLELESVPGKKLLLPPAREP
jgi:hypothetical protein